MLGAVDTDRYRRQVTVLYYRRSGRRRSVNRLMVEQGLVNAAIRGAVGTPAGAAAKGGGAAQAGRVPEVGCAGGGGGGRGGCAGGVRVVAAVTD